MILGPVDNEVYHHPVERIFYGLFTSIYMEIDNKSWMRSMPMCLEGLPFKTSYSLSFRAWLFSKSVFRLSSFHGEAVLKFFCNLIYCEHFLLNVSIVCYCALMLFWVQGKSFCMHSYMGPRFSRNNAGDWMLTPLCKYLLNPTVHAITLQPVSTFALLFRQILL